MTSTSCPHCGLPLPPEPAACPECGSDRETGWSNSYGHVLPDEPTADATPMLSPWVRQVAAILALLAMIPFIVSWPRPGLLLLVLAVLVGAYYYATRKRAGKSSSGRAEQRLHRELLKRLRNDTGKLDRLVDYERRCAPDAGLSELLQRASQRLEHDRR